MAHILKQLIEDKLDVEVIKKKLCDEKLQVNLCISPCKIIKFINICRHYNFKILQGQVFPV